MSTTSTLQINALIFIILAMLSFGCKTTKDISKLTDDDIRIKLKKGGCFGNCPIYTVKVYDGGYVHLFGEKHIDKLGKFEKYLTKEAYADLINDFEISNFSQFSDEYESQVPDLPLVHLTYRAEKEKTFKTVSGKIERPKIVKDLQVKIERLVAANDWTLLEKLPEPVSQDSIKKKPKINKKEIIIEPNNDVNLPKWFAEKKEKYGVRILNKIGKNQNLWLITYDGRKVDGDMMLTILKQDPGIKSAQFNAGIEQR